MEELNTFREFLNENTGRVKPTDGVRKKLFEIGEDLNILLDMHVQDSSEPFLTDSEAKVINEARNIIIKIARLDSYD